MERRNIKDLIEEIDYIEKYYLKDYSRYYAEAFNQIEELDFYYNKL